MKFYETNPIFDKLLIKHIGCVQAQKDESKARAEAELDQLGGGRGASLTGLETIPEQRAQAYDEYGQPIVMDEAYRKSLARERWHWAFTKIVQVRYSFLHICGVLVYTNVRGVVEFLTWGYKISYISLKQ